jgi:hypothetical protein
MGMFDKLPMPIELQQIAIDGYAKYGRGFVYYVSDVDAWEASQYYPANYCNRFNCEYLRRLLEIYNPSIEFILFIDFRSQGKSTYLYPRLLPLVVNEKFNG